ncbi:hypothetical protein [Mariniphaga sp.]|uniref:hypothetical protein n=1 Tax=Mariniphaga sp. TaxID=1954475 RepID=UPI003561D81C
MNRLIFILSFLPLAFPFSLAGNDQQKTNFAHVSFSFFQNESTLNAADFAGRLDELLTLEMATEISGFDASKAEKEHENKTSAIFGGEKKPPRECNYLWNNGRTRSVAMGGNTLNAPYKDKVAIHSLSNTTLERFKRNYGALTDEQKQGAAKKLEEEAGKNNNSSASQNMTQVGTGMVQNLQAEAISGVGDAATWYENSSELKVLYRGLIFSVVVDISDDKEVNREKSIELAKRIIRDKLTQNSN